MIVDTSTVTRLIAEIAAEEVVPRFERLAKGEVTEKGPGDLVTVADLAAERRLAHALTRLLPKSAVIGEEAAAADPRLLDFLSAPSPRRRTDPLDGPPHLA